MTPHPHLTLVPSPPPAPTGRDAGGVPLTDPLRAGLIRVIAPRAEEAPQPPAAA